MRRPRRKALAASMEPTERAALVCAPATPGSAQRGAQAVARRLRGWLTRRTLHKLVNAGPVPAALAVGVAVGLLVGAALALALVALLARKD